MGKPDKIAINHDDYQAKHVGRTLDGLQFFLTTPFEAANASHKGCEYVALFLFDSEGNLKKYEIDRLGPRESLEEKHEIYNSRLAQLGKIHFGRIEIKPFSVRKDGLEFGLILRESEDEQGSFVAEMLPGNYMAFFEPWDSGEYDT